MAQESTIANHLRILLNMESEEQAENRKYILVTRQENTARQTPA